MKKTNDNLTEQERFRIFINRHGGLTSVCDKTGLKPQRLSNYMNGVSKTLSTDVIPILTSHYPKFNIEWWLSDKGSMEKKIEIQVITPELIDDFKKFYKKLGKIIENTEKYNQGDQ